MLSFYLRSLVSFETNADYYGYYMLVQNDFELKVTSVFSEPYFPLAYTLIKSIIDGDRLFSEQALNSIYYINLCITIIFYLWLAILRDVRPWLKIFLFSFFYFLIGYTTIRNSIAYMLFAVLCYEIFHNRRFITGYFSFLFHVSSLPAIGAAAIGLKKITFKFFIYILVGVCCFVSLLNLPIFNHISKKLEAYSNLNGTGTDGHGIFHLIFLVLIIGATVWVYFRDKKVIFNNFFISMFVLYIVLFVVNPVMAFRFSSYVVFYLCMYPYEKYKYDKVLTFLSLVPLCINFIFSFFSNHPYFSGLE
jgi:hypothetical protein